MDNEVLKKYFEKRASNEEIAAVELWLLGAKNEETFHAFLESYWNEHVELEEQQAIVKIKRRNRFKQLMPKLAVAAGLFGVIAFASYNIFRAHKVLKENVLMVAVPVKKTATIPADTTLYTKKVIDPVKQLAKTTEKKKHQKLEKQIEINADLAATTIKKDTNTIAAVVPPVVAMVKPDSAVSMAQKSIAAFPFSKVMINEKALDKLSVAERTIVLNKLSMLHQVHFSDARFDDVAAVLRNKYGVTLEFCASNNNAEQVNKAIYNAQFSEVGVQELINDMSKKMNFSYIYENGHLKICFN